MKKRLLISKYPLVSLFILLFLSTTTINAQSWAFRNGFGNAGADKGIATCMDASGNIYVTGSFVTSIDFGGGALAYVGANDGYVAKFNSSGVHQWSIRFGGAGNDQGSGIVTDGTNVYVTGFFSTSMTVGSSPTAYPSAGGQDGYVLSLNASSGATNWVQTVGGTSSETPQAICIDPSGNVYVSGIFLSNSGTFGSFSLSPNGGTNTDLFVMKLNSAGTIGWASSGGVSSANDNPAGSGICYVPALSEVVVTGSTNGGGTATYGGVSFPTTAANDVMLLEVNASTGAFVSGLSVGGSGNEEALAACYDSSTGDVFFCGYFQSTSLTFPGSGTINNSGSTTDEMFYSRYNPSTNTMVWSKSAGSVNVSGTERARGICSNGTGGIIMTGAFAPGTSSFPSSPSPLTLTNSRASGADIFLVQVAATTGNAAWVTLGVTDNTTATDNSGNAVAANSSGTVWITGIYTSNTTFGALSALTSVGSTDVALAKFNAPPPLSATQSQVNLTCNGVCTGQAQVVASGGTAPYTYAWSPSGGSGATASSLCATNYTCTITDAASNSIIKTFNVTQPPAIVVGFVSQTNISCNGGNNGAAQASASGGTGTLSYNWTPGNPTGDGTGSVTGLTAFVWTVTVTDANSCTANRTYNVTQPPALTVTPVSQTNVSCFGGNNGAASLSASGGQPSYSYNWTPGNPSGDGTASVTGLTAGNWTCTVTDANACVKTATFNVTQPSSNVSGTTVVTNVACFGGSNGAINLTPSGGAGGYTFFWLPSGPTTEDRTGLTAGTYSVQITDMNGCTGNVNATVTQPASNVSGTTVVTNVSCFGGSNGAINLTPTGGSGGYTFFWLPSGPTTEDRTGLTAGTYSVQITDVNGCTGNVNATVTQPSSNVSGTTVVTNVACFGGSTGAINLTPTGGSGGYTFFWLPSGPTTEDRTGLSAGTYSVQITDVNGCTGNVNATVTQPSSNVSGTTVVTNVACFGGSNGAINLTPSGGAGGYTFFWLPSGPTTEDRTGLTAGTYSVQITDMNGCTGNVNATVTQPASNVSGTTVVTNVSCFGGSNGAINLTPAGGTGPYTFNWLPSGPTTEDRTGLTSGTYSVQITDMNGCTGNVNATVTQPTAIATSTSVTNVSCNSGSNGVASVSPSGGAGGFTYSWAPSGGTGSTASGLSAGNYTCTITDANSCTDIQTFNITEPTVLAATISGTNAGCGASDGVASVSASGGTSLYSYAWAPSGGTGSTATGLGSGNYSCTITDANSCVLTKTVTISTTSGPSLTSASQTNVSCNGGSNGSASVNTATGGSTPYSYSWSPSGGTSTTASGLAAGNYTCTVMDNNGCSDNQIFTITQPSVLNLTSASQTNVSCNGGSNGSASVNAATGGTSPYTYIWSPSGGTSTTATGLSAGNYTCTVTDANSCSDVQTFNITQPSVLNLTSASQINISCNGGSDGSASVNTATGGSSPYTYVWSPSGGTATTATGLSAGNYTCTVTDDNGCSDSQTFNITEPTVLTATSSSTNATCSGNNGSASVSPSGGTGSYTYAWAPSGGTSSTATGLGGGTYTCTITDANSCSITKSVTISSTSSPALTLASQTNVSCNGANNGSATVNTATGGTSPYTYSWSPSGGTSTTASSLTAGSYTCRVTDNNGCFDMQLVTITQPTTSCITGTAVTSAPCGTVITNLNLTASATNVTGATQYRFKFYNSSTNALISTKTQATRTLTFNTVSGIYYGNTYKWTVSVDKGTGFGPESNSSCLVILAQPKSTLPCGVTYPNLNSYTTCQFISGAKNYRFSFYSASTSSLIAVKTQTSNYIYFDQVPGLKYGNTYKWTVEVEYNNGSANVFGPATSNSCTIAFSAPTTTVPCGLTYAKNAYTSVPFVSGASAFRYTFYDATTSALVATVTNTNQYVYFNQVPGLIFNKAYKWTVEVRYNNGSGNVFGPPSSNSCTMNYGTPSAIIFDGSDPTTINNGSSSARFAEQSIQENENAWVNVFPNPNNGSFNIATNKNMSITIVNEFGQIVRTQALNQDNNHEVNIKELSNGIYFLIGQTQDNNVLRQKIIVNQ